MFSHRRIASFALVLAAGLAVVGPAAAEDKVLAKIDGQPITDADVAQMSATMAAQLAQIPEDMRKRAVLDRLIDLRLIAAAATKAGLDQSPSFKSRMEQVRAQLLLSEYVKTKVEAEATPAKLKDRYDRDVAAFDPPEEMHARHILVKTEDEAKAIIADLAKGGDFAKIAEEKSQDPGSAKQGGDLGFFSAGDMVPEFEKACQELKAGEITKAPVKSQFGFHVIKLEEKRKQPVPSLDQVKTEVKQAVVAEIFTAQLEALKKAAKIEIDEAALKPADKPAAPTAPAAPAAPAK